MAVFCATFALAPTWQALHRAVARCVAVAERQLRVPPSAPQAFFGRGMSAVHSTGLREVLALAPQAHSPPRRRALRARPRPASPSPLWLCGHASRASAPCTWAKASVSSRTDAPSAPRCCAHGQEREGRSVERVTPPRPRRPRLCPEAHRRGAASAASGHHRLAHERSQRYAWLRSGRRDRSRSHGQRTLLAPTTPHRAAAGHAPRW